MDWRLRLRAVLGVATVGLGVAAPVTAVTLRLTESRHAAVQPAGAPALTPVMVARRYAPILRLDSRELLLPIDRNAYIAHAALLLLLELRFHVGDRSVPVDPAPRLDTLPTTAPTTCPVVKRLKDCHYTLALRGLQPRDGVQPFKALQDELLAHARPKVYWHYDTAEHAIQYWFFYDFNYFLNYHEGDWEQVTITFEASKPLLLAYSSHHNGQKLSWSATREGLERLAEHPIVYVALGSHANYFFAGSYPVSECKSLCSDNADGAGRLLTPSDYRLSRLDGSPAFDGDYGTGNFIAKGLRRWGFGINVADPQRHQSQWDTPAEWSDAATPARDPNQR
jgi:hypothetical protein